MKPLITLLISATMVGAIVERITRETNSRAASERAVEAWQNERPDLAAENFAQAATIAPSAETAFGLGTALAETGAGEEAAELLMSAASSLDLAASSFYNLGTMQLEQGDLEASIESLKQSLRYDPASLRAKRNLEIAQQMQRREEQRRQQQQQDQQQDQPQDDSSNPEDQEGDGEEPTPGGEDESQLPPELEALLQSVEEQEQQELSRMRKARARSRGIDW